MLELIFCLANLGNDFRIGFVQLGAGFGDLGVQPVRKQFSRKERKEEEWETDGVVERGAGGVSPYFALLLGRLAGAGYVTCAGSLVLEECRAATVKGDARSIFFPASFGSPPAEYR